MHPATSLLCALSLAAIAYGHSAGDFENRASTSSDLQATCRQITGAVSNATKVNFPSDPQYLSDVSHAYSSSSQASACSVEPGSAGDVSKILRILGSSRTPFAVKGGGHTSNPGFSSTTGVQISMTRFKDIKVDKSAATVEVGAGLTWDQVYAALDAHGVNVVGGRIPGVGVAGLALGGGYAWQSSQYGLTVDNIAGYELVLPNGTITSVTSGNADLFFALRGALNNFGIVTKFIFKSHSQGKIWGGFITYSPYQLDEVKDALVKFQAKKDTKATSIIALSYLPGQILPTALLFYNAPTPPQGIFDDFLGIPSVEKNVTSRSFYDLVSSLSFLNPPVNVSTRAYFSGISVTRYSRAILDAFGNQTNKFGGYYSQFDQTLRITAFLEPFDSGIFSHGSDSAYPPDRSQAIFPSALAYTWSNALLDNTFARALRQHSDALLSAALAEGQSVSNASVYVNYALFDTPLEDMYGGNVPRLRKIRAEIDPGDVMGLAGGFKF